MFYLKVIFKMFPAKVMKKLLKIFAIFIRSVIDSF